MPTFLLKPPPLPEGVEHFDFTYIDPSGKPVVVEKVPAEGVTLELPHAPLIYTYVGVSPAGIPGDPQPTPLSLDLTKPGVQTAPFTVAIVPK